MTNIMDIMSGTDDDDMSEEEDMISSVVHLFPRPSSRKIWADLMSQGIALDLGHLNVCMATCQRILMDMGR